MSTYTHHAVLDHPRQEVADWYAAPGAFRRLTPEFGASVLAEPSRGLAVGSEAELLLGPPWAQTFTPSQLPLRPGLRWRARHTQYAPGESFTDVMQRGPLQSWTHRHGFQTEGSGTRVSDVVDWALPQDLQERSGSTRARVERELDRVFAYRTAQTAADLQLHARIRALRGPEAAPMTVVVAGASGFVGTQLCALLRSGGHRVIRLKRRTGYTGRIDAENIAWDPSQHRLDAQCLVGADAVINLAGAGIAGRFTRKHKQAVLDSRLDATHTLVAALREVADRGGPRALISASASGYYGHDAGEVTEDSPAGTDFLARVCRDWEEAAQQAEAAGIRVVLVRTGLVLGAAGGLLGAQLPLYLAGGGGPMAGGAMWQPWISLQDLIQIYAWAAADTALTGPVNAAAPHPVRQQEFARTLGRVLHRPAVVPVPAAAPAAVLGREGAQELALASVAMRPEALEPTGCVFRYPELEDALRFCLGRTA